MALVPSFVASGVNAGISMSFSKTRKRAPRPRDWRKLARTIPGYDPGLDFVLEEPEADGEA